MTDAFPLPVRVGAQPPVAGRPDDGHVGRDRGCADRDAAGRPALRREPRGGGAGHEERPARPGAQRPARHPRVHNAARRDLRVDHVRPGVSQLLDPDVRGHRAGGVLQVGARSLRQDRLEPRHGQRRQPVEPVLAEVPAERLALRGLFARLEDALRQRQSLGRERVGRRPVLDDWPITHPVERNSRGLCVGGRGSSGPGEDGANGDGGRGSSHRSLLRGQCGGILHPAGIGDKAQQAQTGGRGGCTWKQAGDGRRGRSGGPI